MRRQLPLTFQRKLGGSIRVHGSPVSLVRTKAIISYTLWLPWLIKGLEVEGVVSPCQHAANAFAIKLLGIGCAADCLLEDDICFGWPTCLAGPHLDVVVTSDRLDVLEGLHYVVEISVRGIGDGTTLPEAECVDKSVYVSNCTG